MTAPHEPSPDCISARLAGRARASLAVQLERDVLGALAGHEWTPYASLRDLAPEGRAVRIPELEGEEPFGHDTGRGSAFDTGPSGEPDGRMLADVITHLRDELLTGEGSGPDAGRSFRLWNPGERIGLGEIGERLGVKRDTVDHWRIRGVLPETGEADGRRPRWAWQVIRDWAIQTGRAAVARRTMWLKVVPLPEHPERMPEPLPEGARWDDVHDLPPFRDDAVQAWVREHGGPHAMLLVSPTNETVYGQPPHLSAAVTASLEITVAGADLPALRDLAWRGWRLGEDQYEAQMTRVRDYLRKAGTADREQIRRATGVPWETLRRGQARIELSSMYGQYSLPEQTSFPSPDDED